MPLEIADLIGGLEEIEVVSAQMTEKDGNKILVVNARLNGEEIDSIGFFGEDVIKAALEKGEKRDGKILLRVPREKITRGERRISWLSSPF